MNVKQIINFKMIREKGPAAFDLKDDEVVQLVSAGKEIKCIVTQEYLLNLESCYSNTLIRAGLREEKLVIHDADKIKSEFKAKLMKLMKIAKEDLVEF